VRRPSRLNERSSAFRSNTTKNSAAVYPVRLGRLSMDIVAGFLIAAILLFLCVGFGLAVSTSVTRLLTGSGGDDGEPPDRR
jgi:hypothetical protein